MNKPFLLSLARASISLFQAMLSGLNGPSLRRKGWGQCSPQPPYLTDRSEEAGTRCNLCDDKNSSSPCQNSKNNFHIILCATALKFAPQTLSEIPYSHFDGAVKYWFVYVCDMPSNMVNRSVSILKVQLQAVQCRKEHGERNRTFLGIVLLASSVTAILQKVS